MQKLGRLLRAIDVINLRWGVILSYLVIPLMVVVLYEVIARYAFDSPTTWGLELSEFIFAASVILGGAYAILHRVHVRVDMLYNRFSRRGRLIADVIGFALFLAFCVMLLWQGSIMAWTSLELREKTNSYWGAPLYPLKIAVPVGVFLTLLQGTAHFIRDLVATSKGERV